MKKTILAGAVIGTAAVLSAGAIGGYLAWKDPAYAEVVSVEPVTQIAAKPGAACGGAQIMPRKAGRDDSRIAGIVIDGMAGGKVRYPVENSEGRAAVTGAPTDSAGDRARNKMREKKTDAATTLCRPTNHASGKIIAYDVRYRLRGKTSKVRMDHDPGLRLPVRDGKVVLTPDAHAGPDREV